MSGGHDPFRFPDKEHERVHAPEGYATYSSYKEWLRDEFEFRCVYCLARETWGLKGAADFSVDHVKGQEKYPHLVTIYSNLVYACIMCNCIKSNHETLDPCSHAFGKHLRIKEDMSVEALSPEGRDLIDLLYLNNNPSLAMRQKANMIRLLYVEEPTNPAHVALFMKHFGYPDDLPSLSRMNPPNNPKECNVINSHYERRKRGDLPDYY